MKKLGTLALTLSLLAAGGVNAAEVLEETRVQTTGKATGGMSGMMIGAVGGPIGMLIGAGVGALFGGEAQEAAGLGERAYKVRTADGSEKVMRSPNERLVVGGWVETRGNRVFSDTAMADDSLYDGALSLRD